MKLLAVIENLDNRYGGPANSLPNLLSHLQKNYGLAVEVVSVRLYDNEVNEHIERTGIPWDNSATLVGPTKIMYSPTLRQRLSEVITKDTIVYINNLWNYVSYCAYVQARRKGAKVITAPRGGLFSWSLQQRYWLKKLAWIFFQGAQLKCCDRIHVTSDDEFQAVHTLGVKTGSIGISTHGVYVPTVRSVEKAVVPEGSKYFLFLSRLHPKKGILELLSWWQALAGDYPDWTLVIAGPDYGDFSRRCDGPQTCYVGSVHGAEKWQLLANAQFLALPSHTENFGIVIAEALGAGTPVITTHGTPWESLNEFDCGQWVAIAQFREALINYLSMEPAALIEAGLRGKNLIQERYSWSAQSHQFYHHLIAPIVESGPNT